MPRIVQELTVENTGQPLVATLVAAQRVGVVQQPVPAVAANVTVELTPASA